MRKREWFYIATFLVLAWAYLDKGAHKDQLYIEERQASAKPALSHPIGYSATMKHCAGYECSKTQYVFHKDR